MSEALLKRADKVIMPTYSRFNIAFESGNGCVLKDTNGKEYLDFVAGIAVDCLGHNHPGLNKAIADQCQKIMHVSNLYYTEPQIETAEVLVKASGLDKVFFCNSGAEANEAAMKLARIYAKHFKSKDAVEIIAMDHSFHGRTYGAISATGQPKYQKDLEPLLPGIKHIPFNNLEALKETISDKTCAILLEPIQGEGGIYPADYDYLQAVRKICDDEKIVLIFDEVQSGIGRSGKFFAYQHYNLKPDIVCMAKGIAGGFPMGGIIACDEVAQVFVPGTHASTFGGNPLATAASHYVLNTISDPKFLATVAEKGDYLMAKLNALKADHPNLIDVRGKGLMVGAALSTPTGEVVAKAMDKGLLLVGAGNDAVRFVPPLIVTKDEINKAVEIFAECL
ncbi:MAG: acetylornithine transaminase [Eubacterium sp.]